MLLNASYFLIPQLSMQSERFKQDKTQAKKKMYSIGGMLSRSLDY